MGLLRNLEIMLGGIITRKVDSALYNWIEAVSQLLDGDSTGIASGLTVGAMFQVNQANWFIDPVNGNDSNDGSTAVLALKTDARRQVLWGGSATAVLKQPVTVTYLSSPPATDVVNFNVAYTTGGSLTVTGTKTVTNPAIALTAVTALNRGTQTPWDVTGVGLGAPDVGRLMRITGGARINNYCGVAKDLTGGKVRISPFGNIDVAGSIATGVPFAQVTPQIGDVVEVFTVPTLTMGSFVFRALTPTVPTFGPNANGVFFDTIGLDGTSSGAWSMIGTVQVLGAQLYLRQATWQRIKFGGLGGIWGAGGIMTNTCQVQGGFSNNGGPFCNFFSFLMSNGFFTVQAGAAAIVGGDCLFQNASLQSAGNLFGEFVSIFDRSIANTACQIFNGGIYRSASFGAGDLLWGDGNTGVAVRIKSGGQMDYTTKPTINTPSGPGRMSIIGGTNKDWATVPYIEGNNNAMIVADA